MGWKKMVVTARNNQEESYWRRRNTMADISVEEVWNRIACSDPVLGWKEHGQTVQMQAMSGDRYVTWEEDCLEIGRAEQTVQVQSQSLIRSLTTRKEDKPSDRSRTIPFGRGSKLIRIIPRECNLELNI
jgi:hypothetical protein